MYKAEPQQVRKLLGRIYSDGAILMPSKKELSSVFAYHKQHYKLDWEEYCENMPEKIRFLTLEDIPSFGLVLRRYVSQSKAVQSGFLNECVITKRLAERLGLDILVSFLDDAHNLDELPVSDDIKSALEEKVVRFAYVRNGAPDICVVQCGGCTSGDTFIYESGIEYKVEDKEQGAKAGENDCIYDENFKLLPLPKTPNRVHVLIDEMNEHYNLSEFIGHNCPIDSESARRATDRYMTDSCVSIYAVPDASNQLALLCSEDLHELGVISFKGSEVRLAGRNPGKVFTPHLLLNMLQNAGASIEDEEVKIPKSSMKTAKSRRTGTISRWKLNSIFFVRVADVEESREYLHFPLSKVKQLKPTVSPHISFVGKASDVEKFYREAF